MKYEIRDQRNGEVLGQDLEAAQVESFLAECSPSSSRSFLIRTVLPVNISAHVIRRPGEKERVQIESGNVKITVERKTAVQPMGIIGVSCRPTGDTVPVVAFNLEFREYDDKLTDRGIVWVAPGIPASFELSVTGLASEYGVAKILNSAEQAVQNQLLSLLKGALESTIQ